MNLVLTRVSRVQLFLVPGGKNIEPGTESIFDDYLGDCFFRSGLHYQSFFDGFFCDGNSF